MIEYRDHCAGLDDVHTSEEAAEDPYAYWLDRATASGNRVAKLTLAMARHKAESAEYRREQNADGSNAEAPVTDVYAALDYAWTGPFLRGKATRLAGAYFGRIVDPGYSREYNFNPGAGHDKRGPRTYGWQLLVCTQFANCDFVSYLTELQDFLYLHEVDEAVAWTVTLYGAMEAQDWGALELEPR